MDKFFVIGTWRNRNFDWGNKWIKEKDLTFGEVSQNSRKYFDRYLNYINDFADMLTCERVIEITLIVDPLDRQSRIRERHHVSKLKKSPVYFQCGRMRLYNVY